MTEDPNPPATQAPQAPTAPPAPQVPTAPRHALCSWLIPLGAGLVSGAVLGAFGLWILSLNGTRDTVTTLTLNAQPSALSTCLSDMLRDEWLPGPQGMAERSPRHELHLMVDESGSHRLLYQAHGDHRFTVAIKPENGGSKAAIIIYPARDPGSLIRSSLLSCDAQARG